MNPSPAALAALALAPLLAGSPSLAQGCDCNGDPGYLLVLPEEVPIGEVFDVYLEAPPFSAVILGFSAGEGPIDTPFDCLCLDLPLTGIYTYVMPESGTLTAPHNVPCDPGAVGMTAYGQFVSFHSSQTGRSNQDSVTATNGACNDACQDGKLSMLTMMYTGDGCDASQHSQDPDKVDCDGDPDDAPQVRIVANNKSQYDHQTAKVWFDGVVDLFGPIEIDAANAGESRLKGDTWLHILDLDDNYLQKVRFHTSCSQPLYVGDQFGCALLVDFVSENSGG